MTERFAVFPMHRRLALAITLALVVAHRSPLVAQADTARRPAPGAAARKPDLELQPARTLDLDTDEGSWISVDVSPDGKLVVFTSDRDGGDNVWTIDPVSRATKQVTRGKTSRYRSSSS